MVFNIFQFMWEFCEDIKKNDFSFQFMRGFCEDIKNNDFRKQLNKLMKEEYLDFVSIKFI